MTLIGFTGTVVLVVAVAINVFQFMRIEEHVRHNYQVLNRYDTPDLFEIAIARDTSARRYVGPFYYLGELFPDSVIIMPEGGLSAWFTFDSAVSTFGRARSLEQASYDPRTVIDPEDIEAFRIYSEDYAPDVGRTRAILDERTSYYAAGERTGIIVIGTPDGPPGRYDHIAFVDTSVLSEDVLKSLGIS